MAPPMVASGFSQEDGERATEWLAEWSSCLDLLMHTETERDEEEDCKMLTAHFSDGGKTGFQLLHLHLKRRAQALYQKCLQ